MKKLLLLFAFAVLPAAASAQSVGVKTNLLYWGTATPNLGVEVGVGKHITLNAAGSYNPIELKETATTKPSIRHWSANFGARYWFCKSFEGLFLGVEGIYADYLFENFPVIKKPKDYRYDGTAYGGGLVLGNHWVVGRRWGIEVSAGVGFAHMEYWKYYKNCGDCVGKYEQSYFGPTKLNVSLIYLLK